jgi:hypothetical protein
LHPSGLPPLRAAFERERALAAPGRADPDASGVLVLAPDGRARLCTPAAEAWLQSLREMECGGEGWLPTPVGSALARLRAAPDGLLSPAVTVPTPAGRLRVEASFTSEGMGSWSCWRRSGRPPHPSRRRPGRSRRAIWRS